MLGVRKLKEKRFVPHITLFGPADMSSLQTVMRSVQTVGRDYVLVPFKLAIKRGEFRRPDANWLFLEVEPSPELEQFRWRLAQELCKVDSTISRTCQPWDHDARYKFHCSIGKFDPGDKNFASLAEFAETKLTVQAFKQREASLPAKLLQIVKAYLLPSRVEDDTGIHQHLVRVTVLGSRRRIRAEYDLILRRVLGRREALSRYWWKLTVYALKAQIGRPREDYLSMSQASKCYLIGDTHFDHKNTIFKFIHRPFRSTREMNDEIKDRWNRAVSEGDTVYFLGDYTKPPARNARKLGSYFSKLESWTRQLNGTKISILGNHDRVGGPIRFEKARILHVGGHSFLLIHSPAQKNTASVKTGRDWIVHGHVHNNNEDRYPFINGEQKTINVSVEMTDYKPVNLKWLISLNLDSIKRMRTATSEIQRW